MAALHRTALQWVSLGHCGVHGGEEDGGGEVALLLDLPAFQQGHAGVQEEGQGGSLALHNLAREGPIKTEQLNSLADGRSLLGDLKLI